LLACRLSERIGFQDDWLRRPVGSILREIHATGGADFQIGRVAGFPAGRLAAKATPADGKSAIQQVGKPALREPSRAEPFQRSRKEYAITPQKPKTYRRFSGAIFFGGGLVMQVPYHQRLASRKISKNRKNSK
jgi:hypothetical protein